MNESMVKYLAGLLDADGSLSFRFRKDANGGEFYFVGLSMNLTAADNVDKKGFVHALPEQLGMGAVYRYGKDQQFTQWLVHRRAELEMLLPRVIKHMVFKGRHWQWLLDQWRANRIGGRGWTCTAKEREALTLASTESRKDRAGPVKPKNHPTWAWLAGYLDGDGTYYRKRHKCGPIYESWSIRVSATAHENDVGGLEFIHKAFGGRIEVTDGHLRRWTRSLGYQSRDFALGFLPNLAKHSRLKREQIDAIIHHHRQRLTVPGTEKTFCQVEECGRPSHGHRLCSMHYQRKYKAERRGVSDSLNAS